MAHSGSLAPWSFTAITTTATDKLLSGLRIFQCKTAGCKRAQNCSLLQAMHEDNGWREFPSNSESKVDMINDLLKVLMFIVPLPLKLDIINCKEET